MTKKRIFPLIPSDSPYYDYKLCVLKKYIHNMILIAGLFNIMLLVPDLALADARSRIGITVIRVGFSLLLFGISIRIKDIRSFRLLSAYLTVCEINAILIFLFVYSQYSQPNFLIQTMGMITIIILIFFIPNRWICMLTTAISGSVCFFVSTFAFVRTVNMVEFLASAVYVSIAVLICSLSAWNSDRHQFREYETKCELEHLSSTDYLTNTANRHKMKEEAVRWMDFCRRQGLSLCLVFADVDNLKAINDRYGHSAGDSVLKQLAFLIQNHLRKSDTVARWGGDEFLLLLPNIAFQNAIAVTERIRNSIRKNAFEQDIRVTCSFGIVEMREDSTFETMISQSDKLMYNSKTSGKDTIQWEH